ncbi:YqjF family protein [Mucilaginibacter sp. BT774]|uniref:YqjF family protein n=1 Tax=Mucilaginibacter sp. BT774 TaxID=3062276 RepID=UPI00267754DE|nr:DUF2071 domain-containing protein [Mucilaginibacter sp. BT774]MDO3626035.1 DUF2071 domain-containing protein [Mucilaginibacter sp. BT774]
MSVPNAAFLTAKWNNLIMLNYEVDPEVLKPHLPPFTELDLWQGKALVSMVGFLFRETRVKRIKWPLHTNFEEVNLRFYVKYFDGEEWKRGAVFVSEIVPKPMIASIANNLYKEHYSAMPMRHSINSISERNTQYLYEWKLNGRWNRLGGTVNNKLLPISAGSQEEFILEHYWGYNKIGEELTMEYQVEHISWNAGTVTDTIFDADIAHLYGKAFEPFLNAQPYSAFFADGSDIIVRGGTKIRFAPKLPELPVL